MALPAQVLANRENAQSSTGPVTAAGKAASCRNATQFGLFSTAACILPGEQEEYAHPLRPSLAGTRPRRSNGRSQRW